MLSSKADLAYGIPNDGVLDGQDPTLTTMLSKMQNTFNDTFFQKDDIT